ncbi:uncharacterized protein BKA78DRAFT_307698 [Phyllosticta capitalensis]|uniref:uncharacterized protein n=1 Tax=Phyllosticta capitalensis TaxID=121624 RepID=UPI00312F7A0F
MSFFTKICHSVVLFVDYPLLFAHDRFFSFLTHDATTYFTAAAAAASLMQKTHPFFASSLFLWQAITAWPDFKMPPRPCFTFTHVSVVAFFAPSSRCLQLSLCPLFSFHHVWLRFNRARTLLFCWVFASHLLFWRLFLLLRFHLIVSLVWSQSVAATAWSEWRFLSFFLLLRPARLVACSSFSDYLFRGARVSFLPLHFPFYFYIYPLLFLSV